MKEFLLEKFILKSVYVMMSREMIKMKELLKKIQEYDQIVLYRHVNPDLDAFGSQVGLYHILNDSFENKNIVLKGEFTNSLVNMFIDFPILECKENTKTLGIVLDTGNRERIDGDISICDEMIKIDHHIVVDSYGDINIEDSSASSCSQIITLIYDELKDDLVLSQKASECLYLGMVGDSNRFMYSSTSAQTFKAAAILVDTGINIEKLYQKLYLKDQKDLEVTKYILNHYHFDEGIAYYVLTDDSLKQLGISREEGSSYVNTLANVEQFKIWLAITENSKDSNYRVSIRSRGIAINEVAAMFNGGGHAYASGATLNSYDELDCLINKLKEKINE
jgi:phosphoesterase RecJ-like protein